MDPPARNSLVAFFDAVGRAIDGPVTWFRGDKMFIFNPNDDCLMIEFHMFLLVQKMWWCRTEEITSITTRKCDVFRRLMNVTLMIKCVLLKPSNNSIVTSNHSE